MITIAGISGSLRQYSFNTSLLKFAAKNAPAGCNIQIHSIADVPLYNGDVNEKGIPDSVQKLDQELRKADGILIVSPEYNYSIPGVLKNVIDWLSRVPNQAFDNKPVAIMGASMGGLGTARMQYHLRQTFVYLNSDVLARPEVFVGAVHEKIDAEGQLTHPSTQEFIIKFLQAFVEKIQRRQ